MGRGASCPQGHRVYMEYYIVIKRKESKYICIYIERDIKYITCTERDPPKYRQAFNAIISFFTFRD